MEERYYTISELAKLLKVSRTTLYAMIDSGELLALRVGKVIRVPESAVKRLLVPVAPGQRDERATQRAA